MAQYDYHVLSSAFNGCDSHSRTAASHTSLQSMSLCGISLASSLQAAQHSIPPKPRGVRACSSQLVLWTWSSQYQPAGGGLILHPMLPHMRAVSSKTPLCLGPLAHVAWCLQALGSFSMGQQGHRDSCPPALSSAAAHLQPSEAHGHERGHWQISCSSPVSCHLACAAACH